MTKDIFKKPFDEGTKLKLEIYEEYLREWLPVFLTRKEVIWNHVNIFDFFAGEGQDCEGTAGSPMRTMNVIEEFAAHLTKKDVELYVAVNELNKQKFKRLEQIIGERRIINYKLKTFNSEFQILFDTLYGKMKGCANLVFLDQNGVKEINEVVFKKLTSLKQTDILFFISSSYLNRFISLPEFSGHFKLSEEAIKAKPYSQIHRMVFDYYKSFIPGNKQYFLAPFSIKKGANIYGLIFGSNHSLGIEKFLKICWNKDRLRGDANFDIDEEKISFSTPSLFAEYNIPKKKQIFENDLCKLLKEKKLLTNKDVYLYGLQEGFLPKHVNEALKRFKSDGLIDFDFPLVNQNVHKITLEFIKT